MDFELTDDQQELQRVVREVAEAECPAKVIRAVAEDREDGQVDALWQTYVSLDWPGLALPTEVGGSGATSVELALVLEELGRVADPTPFLATTSQYAPLVAGCGDDDQQATLLGAVCRGGTGAASFDPDDLDAEATAEGWRVRGVAHHVVDGDRAERLALAATTEAGPAVVVVEAGEVAATRSPSFDSTLHVAEVGVDGAVVGPDRVMTGPGVAEAVAQARLVAVGGLAATMVGASQRILEMVVDHVRSRHQFGVPIGSFQAVKHMLVDVYVAIERARALCHFAALTLAESDDRAPLATSMAKAAAGDCQRLAVQHGVQLFGGLGFTWENDLQLYLRRAKAGELLLGSAAEHRARVARIASAPHLGGAP